VAVVKYTCTHTNNTENDTKQTIHRTTQKKYIEQHKKIHRTTQKLGRVQAVSRLCGFYPGICLTTVEKPQSYERKLKKSSVKHNLTEVF